jgi:CDP-glycerol glycerophosphotransferase (TagB/SpsB family)
MTALRHPGTMLRSLRNAFFGPRTAGLLYLLCARLIPPRRRVVLLESHRGEAFGGNPYYLLRHLLASRDHSGMQFVVVCSRANERAARAAFADHRVRYCRVDSMRYAFHLATAGFLINDVAFPPWFSRREGQLYLNTWHGTPLKALGIGVARTPHSNLRNMQRNFLHASHILFPNTHTERVLTRDFGLQGLWSGRPVRCGYPRNDELTRRRLAPRAAVDRTHVAYMPTWRGTHDTLATASQEHAADVGEFIRDFVDRAPATLTLWVKLHPLMRGKLDLSGFDNVREFPQGVETYEHLARCDALVTDYSSVMVDFAAGGGAVLLYAPDLDRYRRTQDFSLELTALPFPVFSCTTELVDALASLDTTKPAPSNDVLDGLVSLEDGQCARRVCEAFFSQTETAVGRGDDNIRTALMLVEDRLDAVSRTVLASVLRAVFDAGLLVVLATPGERPEDPLLIEVAKTAGVTFCPSTSLGVRLGRFLSTWLAGRECPRLYGTARFAVLLRLGACPSYRRLVQEFSPAVCLDLGLRDPVDAATLAERIRRIAAGDKSGSRQARPSTEQQWKVSP